MGKITKAELYDGYGIYLCYACDKCKKQKLGGFRSDYDCDEPIEIEPEDE